MFCSHKANQKNVFFLNSELYFNCFQVFLSVKTWKTFSFFLSFLLQRPWAFLQKLSKRSKQTSKMQLIVSPLCILFSQNMEKGPFSFGASKSFDKKLCGVVVVENIFYFCMDPFLATLDSQFQKQIISLGNVLVLLPKQKDPIVASRKRWQVVFPPKSLQQLMWKLTASLKEKKKKDIHRTSFFWPHFHQRESQQKTFRFCRLKKIIF